MTYESYTGDRPTLAECEADARLDEPEQRPETVEDFDADKLATGEHPF